MKKQSIHACKYRETPIQRCDNKEDIDNFGLIFIREGDLKILLDKNYYPDVMFLPRDGFLVEPCLGSNIWARDYDA